MQEIPPPRVRVYLSESVGVREPLSCLPPEIRRLDRAEGKLPTDRAAAAAVAAA